MTASAKSLFRATRRKPDRGATLISGLHEQRAPAPPRRADDFYATAQPEAVRALLARERKPLARFKSVWEPAVGAGDLAREIEAGGFAVVGSDIVDRGWPGTQVRSFYEFDRAPCQAIITNPPYNEINARDGHGRWLKHTLAMPGWRYAAFLLSWDWPAARANGLGALLDERPFSYCYLMRWKLDFTGEGSPPQRNAWFVWRCNSRPRQEPAFRWLDRIDGRQGALFGGAA